MKGDFIKSYSSSISEAIEFTDVYELNYRHWFLVYLRKRFGRKV
jgi:hypothetical protein